MLFGVSGLLLLLLEACIIYSCIRIFVCYGCGLVCYRGGHHGGVSRGSSCERAHTRVARSATCLWKWYCNT